MNPEPDSLQAIKKVSTYQVLLYKVQFPVKLQRKVLVFRRRAEDPKWRFVGDVNLEANATVDTGTDSTWFLH